MTIVEATKNWFKGWNTDKGCMSREEYWLGFVGFFIKNLQKLWKKFSFFLIIK